MLHSAVAEAVAWTPPPGRVMQRSALVDGVMQMVHLGLKALVRSEATLVPEVVLRETYSLPSCCSKEQAQPPRSAAMLHLAVADAVRETQPLGRVAQRSALAASEGVVQMVYLELKVLVCSEAALLPEIVLRIGKRE
jgi:predicted Rossmann fold nucleotide-binding protein DprA/Smf involved in DNA uptake